MRAIDNPILNSPYEQPDRYYEIGPQGPTGEIKDGRRPSESFIPIAVTKKGKKDGFEQEAFDFDATGERREKNNLINDIRRDVEPSGAAMVSTPASPRSPASCCSIGPTPTARIGSSSPSARRPRQRSS